MDRWQKDEINEMFKGIRRYEIYTKYEVEFKGNDDEKILTTIVLWM